MNADAPNELKFAVCLPEVIDPKIRGGGHLNTLRFAELLAEHCEVRLVSYNAREDGVWFLADVEARLSDEGYVLLLTWGPHVEGHVERYRGRLPIVYYQQSMDWGFRLPPGVPVISMSKYMMAYAQMTWPASPQFYLPPVLPAECDNVGRDRDLDVLVVSRKQPAYVCDTLVPLLQDHCKIEVLRRFVSREELYGLFNRTKVYLYAFAPQRSPHTPTGWRLMEGISTQNLEAMVCGCTVVSDLRGGHADFIEPGVHGHRLMSYSPDWDARQVLNAVRGYPQPGQREHEAFLRETYGAATFHRRVRRLLPLLAEFFRFTADDAPDIGKFGIPSPISWRRSFWERFRGGIHRWRRRWLGKSPR